MRKVIFHISQLVGFTYILVFQCALLHAQNECVNPISDSLFQQQLNFNAVVSLESNTLLDSKQESIFSEGNYQHLLNEDGFAFGTMGL